VAVRDDHEALAHVHGVLALGVALRRAHAHFSLQKNGFG
jgi:hypothetical protein